MTHAGRRIVRTPAFNDRTPGDHAGSSGAIVNQDNVRTSAFPVSRVAVPI